MALNRVSLGFIGFCSILYRFYSNFLGLTKIFGFYGISSFDEGLLRVVIIFFRFLLGLVRLKLRPFRSSSFHWVQAGVSQTSLAALLADHAKEYAGVRFCQDPEEKRCRLTAV